MRLINTTTLEQKEIFDDALLQSTKYAILSHCWTESEISYEEFVSNQPSHRFGPAWQKIQDCCALARRQGIEWAWIDTCCIDKRSSAELTEAINSMFMWYQHAAVCYVFLHDFEAPPFLTSSHSLEVPVTGEHSLDVEATLACLRKCKWWSRGWTLQELLAPSNVMFYDNNNTMFGTKDSLAEVISTISKVDKKFLVFNPTNAHKASIAQRMSWASMRQTTRKEDMAYSLLGIFDVNMPLLYGEGDKAFLRLQQAIIARSNDETIFAWTSQTDEGPRGILARHPSEFADSGNISQDVPHLPRPPYHVTNMGLELIAPLAIDEWILSSFWRKIYRNLLVLNCFRLTDAHEKQYMAITLILPEPLGFSNTLYRNRTTDLVVCDPKQTRLWLMYKTSIINMKHHIALLGSPEKLMMPQASATRVYRPYTPYRRLFSILPLLYIGSWWHPPEKPWTFADITLTWSLLTFSWQLTRQSSTHLLYLFLIVVVTKVFD